MWTHRDMKIQIPHCLGLTHKNPRPPPGPGDAGVNGAEESAPPGSEKPTGLFSLIRAAWAGSLDEVVGIGASAVQTTKKDAPMGHPFLLYTKRTGLEPATSAVTGLRSNQTELPLRRIYRFTALQRERAHYTDAFVGMQDFF